MEKTLALTHWAGRNVVITGGGSGIGAALAGLAARNGASVAVVDIDQTAAEAVADGLVQQGARARAYGCDVADDAAMEALAGQVQLDLGGVDVLFNNAGVSARGAIDGISAADVAWVISVNIVGAINGLRAFAPMLRASAAAGRASWIINTGSEHSLGVPAIGAANIYTTTKHALLGLSDVMRHDLQASGIGVSILCPGLADTRIYESARNRPDGFGGPTILPEKYRERAKAVMAAGQDPMLTAELCFEGLARGDFIIITDPNVRPFVEARTREILSAVQHVERRLAQ